MSTVFVDVGMSLDGFIAGPNGAPDNPLGDGGTRIHEWVFQMRAWRESQGMDGGETNQSNALVEETISRAGAYVMGRRMFDEGEHNWPDPPPFGAPVFVLTSQPRTPWERQGGTTFYFVTDGIESAIQQARDAAGSRDIRISGGASTIQQYLNAGLVDEMQIHLAPVFLGNGVRLFDSIDQRSLEPELDSILHGSNVVHMRYRLVPVTAESR